MRVLVTGGSRGIGLGICTAFAERGDGVIAVCRTASPALRALDVQIVEGVDMTSDADVATLPAAVGDGPLDAVICNAAINPYQGIDDLVAASVLETLDVNSVGPVRVVLALLPKLLAGSKIVLVGSGGYEHIVVPPTASVGNYAYRMSKAALVSLGHSLARDLRDRGIAVAITSPGVVNTDQLRLAFETGRTHWDPADAADPVDIGRLYRDRIDELTLEMSPAWQRDPTGTLVTWPYQSTDV